MGFLVSEVAEYSEQSVCSISQKLQLKSLLRYLIDTETETTTNTYALSENYPTERTH